jgi:CheY-like chemotaxis protein
MSQAIKQRKQRILIIDYWENMNGDLYAFILRREHNDDTRLVVGGSKGLQAIREQLPDAIFIYLWAGGPDALEFCQQVKAMPKARQVPVIVFGAMAPEEICPRLQRAGATGYLRQRCSPAEVLAARDAALRGESYYPI